MASTQHGVLADTRGMLQLVSSGVLVLRRLVEFGGRVRRTAAGPRTDEGGVWGVVC